MHRFLLSLNYNVSKNFKLALVVSTHFLFSIYLFFFLSANSDEYFKVFINSRKFSSYFEQKKIKFTLKIKIIADIQSCSCQKKKKNYFWC